jgi:hypothetical protein
VGMEERAIVDQSSLYHDAIADKIERHPELLDIPLRNIERWLAQDHSAPHRLEQWRGIILEANAGKEGLARLLSILRDRSEEATHLRSFDPFPGILTREERQRIIKQCAFSH